MSRGSEPNERRAEPTLDESEVAAPPPMPVQSAIYILPDGRVRFGALFEELVPVAQALDPTQPLACTTEEPSDPA